MSQLDIQEGGSHYKEMAIQPVQYNHENKLPFIEGSVVKYVSRHRNKNGAADIRKAIHFLNLLLELEYQELQDPVQIKEDTRTPMQKILGEK